MDASIKRDIDRDFNTCKGGYDNICTAMKEIKKMKIKDDDSEEIKGEKQGRIDDILVTLGRLGEASFKYLLKVKRTEMYPNDSYDQFVQAPLFKNGPINDLVAKHIISQADADEITSLGNSIDQKFHNFVYLGLIVKKLLPETYANFEKSIEYNVQSRAVYNVLKRMDKQEIKDGYEKEFLIFPCLIWTGSVDIDGDKLKEILNEIKSTASTSGDIFSRFRYYSENKNDVQYDTKQVREIFNYIGSLVKFADGIHKNNNNLLTKPESIHGREMALKYSKLVGRDEQEINFIFDDYPDEDPLYLSQKLFSGYSEEELQEIEQACKKYGLDSYMVIENGIMTDQLSTLYDNHGDDYLKVIFGSADGRMRPEEIQTSIPASERNSTSR